MSEVKNLLPYDDTARTALIRALDGIQSDQHKQREMLEVFGRIARMDIPAGSLAAVIAACSQAHEGLTSAMAHASDLDWELLRSLTKIARGLVKDLESRAK